MKKYLLPPVTYYKANLHTHSTISDGKLAPEAVRDLYRNAGYSILALTDHSVTVAHQDLSTDDFVMLTGVEIDMDDRTDPKGDIRGRNRHLCLIFKDPNRQWIPYRDPDPIPSSLPYEALDEVAGMSRDYTPEAINAVIAECNRQGCLVTYNHPVWSLESYPDYSTMKGLWGMEYRNTGCLALGYDENNGQIYQDMLNLGNFLMPVMADDMHDIKNAVGHPTYGQSWNMVGAEKLEYGAVYEALKRGDLYGSCGPEIKELSYEDGIVHVECSPCTKIYLMTQTRRACCAYSEKGDLIQADLNINNWLTRSRGKKNAFFRLILTAPDGSYAVTRAYRMEEL